MGKKLSVFDEQWLKQVRARESYDSWIDDVIADIGTTGGIYLTTLRLWFERYPLTNKPKRNLKRSIESFNNEDHLGAANELSWWVFMQHCGLQVTPIPATSSSRPDFKVDTPSTYFIEVTTLNVSAYDKNQFRCKKSANLDNLETLRRILLKFITEKNRQMSYAANQKCPCVLVLFDYTTWSAFGAQFFSCLAEYLLSQRLGFKELPADLSALVYVERKVMDGKIAISQDRSAIYYNPYAKYPLPEGMFPELHQHYGQRLEEEPKFSEHWVWL